MYGTYIHIILVLNNIVYRFVPCMVALKLFLAFFGGRNFLDLKSTKSLSRYCKMG